MKKKLIILQVLFLISLFVSAQNKSDKKTIDLLHRAQQALTDVIVHDIFSPPVASRIYVYSNIAAYETLVKSQAKFKSLHEFRESFPNLPGPVSSKKVDYNLAAVYSFMRTARNFVFSETRLNDSLDILLTEFSKIVRNKKVFERSVAYGKLISDSIISWSTQDQYKQTRSIRRYSFVKQDGLWKPTPPAYMAAVEPYWAMMRPLVMDSSSQFAPAAPAYYSYDTTSEFYRQANEVYGVGKYLSREQRDIALFWDCNPFFVNTSGHLVFATKKLSPGGHWISIAGIASRKAGADIIKTAYAYTITAIALYDGFISCWDEKYRSNYIRPETFINSHIDESWRPLLQTPPFPEYTSGHSVISNAAANVLTALFGKDFSFDDNTETPFGLPIRSFRSFQDAADEAAISRMYGGIHFRDAIVNGAEQGKALGRFIIKELSISMINH